MKSPFVTNFSMFYFHKFQVVYFTATFPFIVLFILFIRGVTLEGAGKRVLFYLKPDFSRLADPQVTNKPAWQARAKGRFLAGTRKGSGSEEA